MHRQLDRRERHPFGHGFCGRNRQRSPGGHGRRARPGQAGPKRPKPGGAAHGAAAGWCWRLHRLRRGVDAKARPACGERLHGQTQQRTRRHRPQGVHPHQYAFHGARQRHCADCGRARHQAQPRQILLGQHHAGQDRRNHHQF